MPGEMRAGKALLAQYLVDRLGYSQRAAAKLVDQVLGVIKQAIKEGRDVELEGIGTLQIVDRKQRQRRQIVKGMKCGPTILTMYEQRKSVRLQPDPNFKAEVLDEARRDE